ncbi:type III-B CRISPR module RAMP protein Cmr4 [Archaeoglobus sp.]
MFEKAVILGLYSVTPVHAGSGAELSVIDLPIQRERHTGYPIIWGQSLKGVLRRAYEKLNDSQNKRNTEIIFGPPTDRAHEHSGAISVGDAKVLLFPVRSLKGVFAYVTCPLVLERFKRDLELAGFSPSINVPTVSEDEAIVAKNSSLLVEDKVILEDVVLKGNQQEDILKVIGAISNVSPIQIDEGRVAIVHDDIFRNLVTMTTEVVARVKIDAKTGTVQEGALWYEEYLPSDTLLYSVIAIGKPKKEINGLSTAEDIVEALNIFHGRFLQVGGNETVGKGFVKLKVIRDEKS